jgi:hypothetical protein
LQSRAEQLIVCLINTQSLAAAARQRVVRDYSFPALCAAIRAALYSVAPAATVAAEMRP